MIDDPALIPIRENIKIVAFDTSIASYDPDRIQSLVERNERILSWLNEVPGVWFLESSCSSFELSKYFYDRIEGQSFFISEVNTAQFSGRFSNSTWLFILDAGPEEKARLRKSLLESDDTKLIEQSSN